MLVVPDLKSGNMLAKQLEFMGDAASAGTVLGRQSADRADQPRRLTRVSNRLLRHRPPAGAAQQGVAAMNATQY